MLFKKQTFCIIFLFSVYTLFSQQYQVSLGSGYTHQSFFSAENGEVLNISNDNWDISFSTDAFSSSIRINDGKGVELYTYPLGDTSSWNNINNSTPNILNQPMYNSDTSWDIGAFDLNSIGGFDYGWGVYNLQTHHIVGDSLFILKTSSNNWKKLWIERKVSGEIFFKYANLDGTNLIHESILASNFSNKRFIYYSLESNSVLDREPVKSEWDITFTKYITEVMGMPYGVTGSLSNQGIEIAKATNINDPFIYLDYNLHNFEQHINSIGYDWKSYQSGGYVLDENRCYFIRDYNNKIWRIIFTLFEGMSTGNIEFNVELIDGSSNVNPYIITNFSLYPNPADDNFTVFFDVNGDVQNICLSDITGRVVYKKNVFSYNNLESLKINTTEYKKGIYIVTLHDSEGALIAEEKLIIN